MTLDQLADELEKRDYSFDWKLGKVIITHKHSIVLNFIDIMPSGVFLENKGFVGFSLLSFLPKDFIERHKIPVLENIDAQIHTTLNSGGTLKLETWHKDENTHCRYGWAIHLAGKAGYALEKRFGGAGAGAMIYAASRPGVMIPDCYISKTTVEQTIQDLKRCAGIE